MKLYLINYKTLDDEKLENIKETMPNRYQHSFCYKQKEDYLRSMAGNYLLEEAFGSEIDGKINYLNNGKPTAKAHYFNISHDNEHVVLAVNDKEEIGVDIMDEKYHENKKDLPKIFTENEIKKSIDINWNLLAFWTRKEAVSKVMGQGICSGFKSIETSDLDPNNCVCYFGKEIYINTIKVNGLWISIASTSKVNDIELIEL